MEFSLPLPLHLAKESILSRQWMNFSQRFQYHGPTSLTQTSEAKTASMLLFAALPDVNTICESLKEYDMDVLKLTKVLEVVEQFCLPRFILLFERFRYFTLEQDQSESLTDFIHALRKQVELCEFGKIKDSIMTNTLVNGVIDQSFKQSLQNSEGLCFDEVVTMCNEAGNSDKNVPLNDVSSVAGKSRKGKKRKCKTAGQSSIEKSMYMMPVYESMNEDMDIDDHIVKTVTKRTKVKRKKKVTSSQSSSRPKIFLCFKCDNEYATRKSYRRHIAAKHGDCKDYFCRHCQIGFNSRTECITHCKGHSTTPLPIGPTQRWKDSTNTEYICWYCDETFPNLPDYKKHSLTHTAVRVFSCELCQKKNHTIARMIGHLKGHLSPKHKCEICANCFGRAELLAAHMQTHVAQPVHQCQICTKSFCSADRLQGHMRTHSGEKRFTCELCGKSFSQKMSFDYHKRWHAGEKPYECDICGRRTRSFGDLRKHKRMHSDKRPYVCEVCGKSFRFISNLNRHRKGHSGKRSFVCDVCGRTFIYGEGLRDHIKAGRCPGRKNEGESKSPAKTPRARAPHIPTPHPHPHQHPLPLPHNHPHPQPQLENDCNPVNYTTAHPPPEALLNEFPPAWQYMLRNNEGEGTSGLVVVPPYY